MYYVGGSKRKPNPLRQSPHVGISSKNLLWNVSLDDLFDSMDGEKTGWRTERLHECDMMLICVNVFGTNKLYKLVDPKKITAHKAIMDLKAGMDTRLNADNPRRYYYPEIVDKDNPKKVLNFFWSLMDIDTAPAKRINLMSSLVPIDKFFTAERALEVSIQRHIVNGLNQFYESNGLPTRASLGFSSYEYEDSSDPIYDEYGEQVEGADRAFYLYDNVEASKILESEVPFEEVIPDFAPDNYVPGRFKFIMDLPHDRPRFTNNLLTSNFNRLFVYIPGFDLWQEVYKKDLELLLRVNSGKITYSKVDDPHCFSKIYYSSEFNMDNVDSILFNAIAIPADIRWHMMFNWQCTDTNERKGYSPDYKLGPYGNENKTYDALTFDFECYKYNLNLTLTQTELGIGNNNYYKQEATGIPGFEGEQYTHNYDFWMLGLINQILALRPSLGDTFRDGEDDD